MKAGSRNIFVRDIASGLIKKNLRCLILNEEGGGSQIFDVDFSAGFSALSNIVSTRLPIPTS